MRAGGCALAFAVAFRYKFFSRPKSDEAARTVVLPFAVKHAVSQEPPTRPPDVPSFRNDDAFRNGGERVRASEVLAGFLERGDGGRILLGDLVVLFADRAFGMLLLILTIPNVIPMPGLSTVTGVPMILLGFQMMNGRHQPWLPQRFAETSFDREHFADVVRRVLPKILRIERRLRPRLYRFVDGPAERFLGFVVVVMATVLSLPIVFGNLPPAIAIALIALGLIERDGAFTMAGVVASMAALIVVASIVFGLGEAAWFVFDRLTGR